MTRAERQFEQLVATIVRLASSADEQRAYLANLGTAGLNDELALEFDDALRPVLPQLDLVGVSTGAVTKIEALSSSLSAMSGAGQEWLWRPEALESSAWSKIRELAAEILELLGRRGEATPGR